MSKRYAVLCTGAHLGGCTDYIEYDESNSVEDARTDDIGCYVCIDEQCDITYSRKKYATTYAFAKDAIELMCRVYYADADREQMALLDKDWCIMHQLKVVEV